MKATCRELVLAGAILAMMAVPACNKTGANKSGSGQANVDTSAFTTADQWMEFLTTSRDEAQWRQAANALAKFPPAELKKHEQTLRQMMDKAGGQATKRAIQAVLKKIK